MRGAGYGADRSSAEIIQAGADTRRPTVLGAGREVELAEDLVSAPGGGKVPHLLHVVHNSRLGSNEDAVSNIGGGVGHRKLEDWPDFP